MTVKTLGVLPEMEQQTRDAESVRLRRRQSWVSRHLEV